MIRIAIATADGRSVAPHLARSGAFLVFEFENGAVVSQSVRNRESDSCGNHKSFVEMLQGCEAVICGGIGQGAFDSLVRHGIKPIVAAEPGSVQDVLKRFLDGTLAVTEERVCLCH